MRNPPSLSPGLYFPLHSGGTYRHCSSKLIPRRNSPRYLLRSSPLSLRPLNGSSFCHHSRLCTLVPPLLGVYAPQHLNENPLCDNISWSKPNLFPTTLSRPCWYAPTILGLSRRLHRMKHPIFCRIYNLPNRSCSFPLHPMRSLCKQA